MYEMSKVYSVTVFTVLVWAYPGTVRAPIYEGHCAVIFAIAQLSCMICIYSKKLHADDWMTGSMQAQIFSSMDVACVLKKKQTAGMH